MAILLQITTAGRAALVDAANLGTAAIRIASAGITATAFVADAGMTALPGEFSRLATVAGAVVDADTIHLVVRDDTAAAYTLRGFALYLADGTLFALYGQADAILEKAGASTALLAVDVRFVDVTNPNLVFNEAGFLNPPATTEVSGVIELATEAEAIAGADAIRGITPASLRAVINARFGLNAASAYVRSLLDAASAAAMRAGLGLGTAAVRNEGPGSGLNADRLDNLDTSNLPGASAGGSWSSIPVINAAGVIDIGTALDFHPTAADAADYSVRLALDAPAGGLTVNGGRLWHAGNDGSGSGLDADLLDGFDASYFTNIPARLGFVPWHPGNDGAGSGLDADLLDGRDASGFANAAHGHVAADLLGAFRMVLGASGVYEMPGGFRIQWGTYGAPIVGEVTVTSAYFEDFPNACFIVIPVGLNLSGGNDRDLHLQLQSRSRFGFSMKAQRPSSSTALLDGFDWIAIGN